MTDMARILEEEMAKGAFPAVLHCFTGSRDLALRAVALGRYVSFTGILTFKNSDDLRAIAAELPAGPHLRRDRRALSRARAVTAASATSRPMWWKPPRSWPRCAA